MAEIWVAAAATVVGGGLAYAGSQKAAKTAAKGDAASIAEQQREFDLVRGDTANQRAIGDQALNALGSIYGYKPASSYYGPANAFYGSGASPYQANFAAPNVNDTFKGRALTYAFNPGGAAANLLGVKSGSTLDKVFNPLGGLLGGIFGSKHGDEKRNINAFLQQFPVRDIGNGMLALPDGTTFPQSQLQELAGTWYGATYHPDGDQAGWQQKYDDVLGRIKALPQNAQLAANVGQAGGGLTSDGVPQGFTANQGMTPDGQSVSPAMTDPNSPNYGAFFMSPDYQFRKQQGMQGIENSFSASGGAKSGNALRALADFNSNLAAGEFGNYFNRQAALAGIGQAATNTNANAAIATGNNISNALVGQANARASGIQGGYDALGGAIADLGGLAGYYYGRRQNPYGNYFGRG